MREKSRSVELAASLFCLVLIVVILYYLQSVVVPLLFSILIAFSLFPIARRLENWRLPNAAAALNSVTIALVVIAGLLYFIFYSVIIKNRKGEGRVRVGM